MRPSRSHFLTLALLLVALPSCMLAREHRRAEGLISSGRWDAAHRLLSSLYADSGDDVVRSTLIELEGALAERHLHAARAHLARGATIPACVDYNRALLFDPTCAEARVWIDSIEAAEARAEDWERRFCAAVDGERWLDALLLLSEEEEPLLPRRCRGRTGEILELAWDDLRRRFSAAAAPGDTSEMTRAVAGAEDAVARLPALAPSRRSDLAPELPLRHGNLPEPLRAGELARLAGELRRAGDHEGAYDRLLEARALVPNDDLLCEAQLAERERLLAALVTRFDDAILHRDWQRALAAGERMAVLGWSPEGSARLPVAEVRRRATDALLADAKSLEERGLPGNALLALLEAAQAAGDEERWLVEAERLRALVRGAPLVALASETDESPRPSGGDLTVLIRRGTPSYGEKRASRTQNRARLHTYGGEEWRDNPAHVAEEKRRRRLEEQIGVLEREWKEASPLEAGHRELRYRIALGALERIGERLRSTPPQESHGIWRMETVPIDTIEVHATLILPVTIEAPGATVESRAITAELRLLDRQAPPSIAERRPGDPDDLPSASELERRLAVECERKLGELVAQLRTESMQRLLPRARECHDRGLVAEAIELAVRALLDLGGQRDAARLRGEIEALLRQWAPRHRETISRVLGRA